MREEETECIVTPCSECKGGGTRNQILWKERESHEGRGGLKGNYPHFKAFGDIENFSGSHKREALQQRQSDVLVIQRSFLCGTKGAKEVPALRVIMCLPNSTFHRGTWRMLNCSVQHHLPPSLCDRALQLSPLGNSAG